MRGAGTEKSDACGGVGNSPTASPTRAIRPLTIATSIGCSSSDSRPQPQKRRLRPHRFRVGHGILLAVTIMPPAATYAGDTDAERLACRTDSCVRRAGSRAVVHDRDCLGWRRRCGTATDSTRRIRSGDRRSAHGRQRCRVVAPGAACRWSRRALRRVRNGLRVSGAIGRTHHRQPAQSRRRGRARRRRAAAARHRRGAGSRESEVDRAGARCARRLFRGRRSGAHRRYAVAGRHCHAAAAGDLGRLSLGRGRRREFSRRRDHECHDDPRRRGHDEPAQGHHSPGQGDRSRSRFRGQRALHRPALPEAWSDRAAVASDGRDRVHEGTRRRGKHRCHRAQRRGGNRGRGWRAVRGSRAREERPEARGLQSPRGPSELPRPRRQAEPRDRRHLARGGQARRSQARLDGGGLQARS